MAASDATHAASYDPNDRFTVTATSVALAGLQRDDEAYVVHDYVEDTAAAGDFSSDFDINMTSAATTALMAIASVSDQLDDYKGVVDNSGNQINADFFNNAGTYQLRLNKIEAGTAASGGAVTVSLSTDYFCTLSRTGTNIQLDVFTDSGRTTHATGSPITDTVTTATAMRYQYWVQSYNSATTPAMTGTVSNLTTTEVKTAKVLFKNAADALGLPYGSNVFYDGESIGVAFHPAAALTSADPQIVYMPVSDNVAASPHPLDMYASQAPSTNGYGISVAYRFPNTYASAILFATEDTGANESAVAYYKKGGFQGQSNLQSAVSFAETTVGGVTKSPSVAIASDGYVWMAGRDASNDAVVVRSSVPTKFNALDSATTQKSHATIAYAGREIVALPDGDMGDAYCDNQTTSILAFKYYNASTTTWGSEEVIDSNVDTYYSFRIVPLRNGKVLAIWKDQTTAANLRYSVRAAGSAGTWSTAANYATDLSGAAGSGFFTATANHGVDEEAYVFYYDGTNIVQSIWDGSSPGTKSTVVSSPTFTGSRLSAPISATGKTAVVWQDSSGYGWAEPVTLTVDAIGSVGTLITKQATPSHGSYHFSQQMVSVGDTAFIAYAGQDGWVYAEVWDTSTNTLTEGPTKISSLRYWDLHNTVTIAKGDDDKVYIAMGGRTIGATAVNYIEVWKSDYALDHGSFTLSAFTDVSPTDAGGRGYKFLVVDQAGVIYLIEVTGVGVAKILEYRSSTWSSPVTIISVNHLSDGSVGNQLYVEAARIGKESSGQKTIHVFWGFIDVALMPATAAGSTLHRELHYLHLTPDGAGGFTPKAADAGSLTLPVHETSVWSASTAIELNHYTRPVTGNGFWYEATSIGSSPNETGATEPTWPTTLGNTVADGDITWTCRVVNSDIVWDGTASGTDWVQISAGLEVIGTTTPAITWTKADDSAPYTPTEMLFTKWSGSAWVSTSLTTTNLPAVALPKVVIDGVGDIWVVGPKMVSGVQELNKWYSDDDGATFSDEGAITSSSAGQNNVALLSPRTGGIVNMFWSIQPDLTAYQSEVRYYHIEVATGFRLPDMTGGMIEMTGGMRG